MLKYSIKRLLQSVLTLFIIITLVFLAMRLMPEEGYFGDSYEKLDEAQKEAILTNMGLRDPIHKQLGRFYKGLLHGDLGESMIYRPNIPVTEIIKDKIPYSMYFGLAAIGISLSLGVTLGITMARSKAKFWDKLGTGYVVFIQAVPAAVYFLFIQLYITSVFKLPMLFDVDKPITWILPAISMSLGGIASYAMWMRKNQSLPLHFHCMK